MTEISFYHLEHKPWEQVLPRQLATALERGWRCVVQIGDATRVEEVSEILWKNDADLFLTHGTKSDGRTARQPIWLTAEAENPNSANVKFFIEGAEVDDVTGLIRAVILFDGHDENAVARARADWKRFKEQGFEIAYYQQDRDLRWVNKSISAE